jgi:gas vesicle protein
MGIAIQTMEANTLPPLSDPLEMTHADNPDGTREPAAKPRGRPYRNVADARSISMLGMGMVIGSMIGAGIALLMAPSSGAETRRGLSRRVGRLKQGGGGVWSKLGRELQRAAAAKRKSLELEAKRNEIEARRAVRGESVAGIR